MVYRVVHRTSIVRRPERVCFGCFIVVAVVAGVVCRYGRIANEAVRARIDDCGPVGQVAQILLCDADSRNLTMASNVDFAAGAETNAQH